MIFSFFIIISFHLIIECLSKPSDRKNYTCLLPFVTKPCINDGQNLSCTFSLDSSERHKTCNLTSVLLIFTTLHIELFIIPQYYNQLIPNDKYIISKLIIQPNVLNRTYEYLHWPDLRILSIEIPIDVGKFVIIHDKNNLDITRIRNKLNRREYWHLQIWPIKSDKCERTVLTRHNITTMLYDCPYYISYYRSNLCSLQYACFGSNPCYATGYRRLVCRVNIIDSKARFKPLENISHYETIFINVLHNSSSVIHEIDQEAFITKRLVVVISSGILRISSKLFDNPNGFQVRIEHGPCDERQFLLDIQNDTKSFLTKNFVDYTSAKTGAIGCEINKNEPKVLELFKPYISLGENTVTHAGQQIILVCIIGSLSPFNVSWLQNNTPVTTKESFNINFLGSFDNFAIVPLELDIATKDDNGIEYQVIVTNSFGQDTATTRLNITYEPSFIIPLRNQTVKKDSNVTLEAKIDGNPMPDVYIHWLNYHQRLHTTNNNSVLYQYSLHNVQLNDSAVYTFSAVSEGYGINISETLFLKVLDVLYATDPIHNISIEEDENLNLTIPFSHSIIEIQWFVNDTPIENTSIPYTCYIINNQALLIINNISIKHNGEYKVQVWDILNQTNQSLVRIHIYSLLPLIMYCYHGTLEKELYRYIICRFQAKHPQIRWIDPNGQKMIDQSNYESINESNHIFDAKLVFKNILYKHFGIYTFQVTNNGGSVSHKVNFTLKDIPPIIGNNTFKSEKVYVHKGDLYSFILYFNGIPWPNVTFFFNNKILLSYSISHTSPLLLTLKNLSVINEGIYYAHVMNKYINLFQRKQNFLSYLFLFIEISKGYIETNRTEICILQAPSFIIENQQSLSSIISVKPNQSITLITPKIKIGSLDPIKIVWYVKGKTIKLPFNSSLSYSQLTINSSLQQEQIVCIVENKLGENAYFFKLNFLQSPRFILALKKNIEAELGQNVKLTINITGNPLPTIQWFYNKQSIENKRFEQYVINDYGVYSLILINFTVTDIGNYSVIVKNSEDKISSETQITMKVHVNTLSSTKTTILTSTIRRKSVCGDNVIRIIIILLMIGLIVFICVPIFCKQNKLLSLFNHRKDQDKNNQNVSLSESSISETE